MQVDLAKPHTDVVLRKKATTKEQTQINFI